MKKFDVIFVFGGWLVQNTDGSWRTTGFEENDPKSAFGDRWRVDAAANLFRLETASLIVVSGSAGKLAELGAPAVADVMARELVYIGVPQEYIIKNKESSSTYDQLQALVSLVKQHHWRQVIALSNQYHLDRIRTMITYGKSLAHLSGLLQKGDLILKSAEEILLIDGSREWKEIIDKVYKSPRVQEIIVSEQKGIQDIKDGRYRFSFLRLRKAIESDTDFLFGLRNEEGVRTLSWDTDPIPYETHRAWISRSLANPRRILLIAEVNGIPVGQARYDIDDIGASAEVSIAFLSEHRGKGFGSEALRRSAEIIFFNHPSIKTLCAHIKPENARSADFFAKAGYQKTEKIEFEGHQCIEMTKTR